MQLSEFERQERGPYLFDVWRRKTPVRTDIGDIPLEQQSPRDETPGQEMLTVAHEIASWASSNGKYILDLIYGHYNYADRSGWLSFWGVKQGLSKFEILDHVDSVTLSVNEDGSAGVFVDPKWDPEHKLDMTFVDGAIAEVNNESFRLENEILYFA
jgi:hypothetical protein